MYIWRGLVNGKLEGMWKLSWPDIKYHSNVCVEGLNKTIHMPIRRAGITGQDWNQRPPEYEAILLSIRSRRLLC
jgi:hypothetical protein